MFGMTATEFVVLSNTDRDALRVSRCSTWSRDGQRVPPPRHGRPARGPRLPQARGRAGGAAPDRRAVRAAAHAQPARHGVLQQRAHAGVGGEGLRCVRDSCLMRTDVVCIRVGPYCISICTRQVNPLYRLYYCNCDPKLQGFCLKWRYADYGFLENLRRRAGGDHARSPWHVAAFRTGASSAHERRCPGRVRSACKLRVMGVQPPRRAQRPVEAIRLGWSATRM